jgi:hypothetical protein
MLDSFFLGVLVLQFTNYRILPVDYHYKTGSRILTAHMHQRMFCRVLYRLSFTLELVFIPRTSTVGQITIRNSAVGFFFRHVSQPPFFKFCH